MENINYVDEEADRPPQAMCQRHHQHSPSTSFISSATATGENFFCFLVFENLFFFLYLFDLGFFFLVSVNLFGYLILP